MHSWIYYKHFIDLYSLNNLSNTAKDFFLFSQKLQNTFFYSHGGSIHDIVAILK